MKKILISAVIVLILITGFAVGQSQLKDDPKPITNGSSPSSNYSTDSMDAASGRSSSGGESYSSEGEVSSNPISGKSAPSDVVGPDNCDPQPCETSYEPDPTGNPLSKYIVKTGSVSITIAKDSLTDKYDKLVNLIKADGGYIEQDSSREHSSTITVRIPADKLDSSLVKLRKLGKIKSQSLKSSDQAFTVKDYEARLKVLQQRKDVLTTSLSKANASETQYIQEQLFQIQSEIEVALGQQELLKDQIAMSTLTITMNEKGTKEVVEDKKQSLIEKSWEKSSKSFLTSIGGILIVIAATFPFLIVGLIIVVAVKRSVSKRKANKELEKE